MYCSSRGVTTCQERKCSAVNIQLRVQQELSAIIISSQQNLPYVKQIYEAEPLWAFYLLKNLNYDGFVGGSAVPTLNRNDVHAYGISIPPLDLQKSFADKAMKLILCKEKNLAEIEKLQELQGTVLATISSC